MTTCSSQLLIAAPLGGTLHAKNNIQTLATFSLSIFRVFLKAWNATFSLRDPVPPDCSCALAVVAIGEGNILGCFCGIYEITIPSEALKDSVSFCRNIVNKVMLLS